MLPLRHYLVADVIYLLVFDNLLAFVWVYLYFMLDGGVPSDAAIAALVAGSMATLTLWALGLYDRWSLFNRGHITSRLIAAVAAGYVLVLAFASSTSSGTVAAMAIVTGMAGSVALLHLAFPSLSTAAQLQRRLMVVGGRDDVARMSVLAQRTGATSFAIAAVRSPSSLPRSLAAEAQRLGVHEIVVFSGGGRLPLPALLDCRVRGIAVTDHQTFWERELGRVYIEDLDPAWLVYSDGFHFNRVNDAGKRCQDVLLSLFGLALALPVMAVVALLIRLDSPGPVLYVQKRVGRHGREFPLYKFRSMRCDAEQDGVPRWAARNDTRITRLGTWLRKLRLDELPQLYNVLRGDMSLIGPRPERAYFVERLSKAIPYYHLRHQVRPGLTGWAQVNYKYTDSMEDAEVKFSYDLYYLKNRSFVLDALILIQTVQVVLFPKNVH